MGKAAQTVAFTSTPPATAVTGVAYPVTARASSGLPVTFTADGPCVVTVTGPEVARVTLTGAGACTVTASQPGNDTTAPATPVTQTYATAATAQADLRVTVTPGPSIRPAGPLTLTVTVTNAGPADSGRATTQVLTNLPVTDAGGADAPTPALFGSTLLTFTNLNISCRGHQHASPCTTNPTPGLPVAR